MQLTVIEAARLLKRKAIEAGYDAKATPSPVSNTIYVYIKHKRLGWSTRIRVSDHGLPRSERYPMEIRTIDSESAFDDMIASLTERKSASVR